MTEYKIRKNEEGNILFFDVKEVIDLCLENNLLTGEKDNWIAIYRLAGAINPEGWYKEDYHDVIQELMRDEDGFLFLLKELENKGIDFIPSLSNELLRTFDNVFKIEETYMSDFVIEDGVLLEYRGTDEIVIIPDSVKEIADCVFANFHSIESIIFPNSIKKIGDRVCYNCTSLKSVLIPNSAEHIYPSAFFECDNLTIICAEDNYASRYAEENDMAYIEIPEDEFQVGLTQENIEKYIEKYQKEKEGLTL